MFYPEKCDFCGKCLVFCPYVEYDKELAEKQMRELVAG